MSQYGQLTENRTIQGCAKIVFSLHTARIENPYTPQTYSSASNFHEYHSDTPRHPSDSSQTPPRNPLGTWNANRQQQMPRNTARLSQTAPVSLAVSVGVCWHVMFHRDAMGLLGECLGFSWGNLSWIHGNRRRTNVLVWTPYYGVKSL